MKVVALIVCHVCKRSDRTLRKVGKNDYTCPDHNGQIPKVWNASRIKLGQRITKEDQRRIAEAIKREHRVDVDGQVQESTDSSQAQSDSP